jgi:hypothetical protein
MQKARHAAIAGFVLLSILALPGPAAGAEMSTFSETYQVRVGSGDIPTTSAREPAGWSVEQRYVAQHGTTETTATFDIPAGAQVLAAACSCGNVTTTSGAGTLTVHVAASVPAGAVTLTVTTTQPADSALALNLRALDASSVAVVYVPNGSEAHASVALDAARSPGASTDGSAQIVVFPNLPSAFWLTVAPTSATSPPAATGAPIQWNYIAAAFILGCLVWSYLVGKGAVQKRSRKQVAGTAAHVEAAKRESPAILETRKRALMAALKDIELAHQNREVEDAPYDAVKADLKAQTVTVMRALDEAASKKEP